MIQTRQYNRRNGFGENPLGSSLSEKKMPALLTVRDIAALTNLSTRTICRLMAAGQLGEPVRFGRAIRFPREQILNWLYRYRMPDVKSIIDYSFKFIIKEHQNNAKGYGFSDDACRKLVTQRQVARQRFLDDYENGKATGRYVDAELPKLPFGDRAFDIALCSHFLFFQRALLTTSIEFHVASIKE